MFTLVNYLTLPVLHQNVNNYESLAAAENIVIAMLRWSGDSSLISGDVNV